MQDKIINEDLKKLLLEDEGIKDYFIISLLHSVYKEKNKDKYFFVSDFNSFHTFIEEDKSLKSSLIDTFTETLNDKMINDVTRDYLDLVLNEAKQIIITISRLLYIQDKYKDDRLGQDIDNIIKEFLGYIKDYKQDIVISTLRKGATEENKEAYIKATKQVESNLLYTAILHVSYFIYNMQDDEDFISKWINPTNKDFSVSNSEARVIIRNYIVKMTNDAKEYARHTDNINSIINDLILSYNFEDFSNKYSDKIKELKEKYEIDNDNLFNDDAFLTFINDDGDFKNTLNNDDDKGREKINAFYNELYDLSQEYEKKEEKIKIDNKDIEIWRKKAETYIKHIEDYEGDVIRGTFNFNYVLNNLAFNDYQKEAYRLDESEEKKAINIQRFSEPKIEELKDEVFIQATSKQFKAIDNARGGLVTYTETNTQAIKNELREKEDLLKNTYIKEDKDKLQQDIKRLNKELKIAEIKEKTLRDEYNELCEQLKNIYNTMASINKTSDYFKELKRRKRDKEQRKKEIEKVIDFNGWQIDLRGYGTYELVLNERKKEKLTLSIENLSKQVARYTKEEQDMFDFLVNKHLHNSDKDAVKFSLREYEKAKNRVRPTNYIENDIQALRLLFREIWTYYNKDDTQFIFTEKHLFDNLSIKGEITKDINDLDTISLDTEISIEPTETLKRLLKDHDNYLYIKTTSDVMQLNNDSEYLPKRLLKYLNYLARTNKTDEIEISLDKIIEELQHYGLKRFNQLDKHKTYKTEIVDNIDKYFNILEGDNHLKKKFIEVLDRQAFINYDNEFRGKSQETSINEWGKHKVKIKVFNIDSESLKATKKKAKENKKKAIKK